MRNVNNILELRNDRLDNEFPKRNVTPTITTRAAQAHTNTCTLYFVVNQLGDFVWMSKRDSNTTRRGRKSKRAIWSHHSTHNGNHFHWFSPSVSLCLVIYYYQPCFSGTVYYFFQTRLHPQYSASITPSSMVYLRFFLATGNSCLVMITHLSYVL